MKILAYLDSDYEPVVVDASGGESYMNFRQRIHVDGVGNVDVPDEFLDDYENYEDERCEGPIYIHYPISEDSDVGEHTFWTTASDSAADMIIDIITRRNFNWEGKLPTVPGNYMVNGELSIDYDITDVDIYPSMYGEPVIDFDNVEIHAHEPKVTIFDVIPV